MIVFIFCNLKVFCCFLLQLLQHLLLLAHLADHLVLLLDLVVQATDLVLLRSPVLLGLK